VTVDELHRLNSAKILTTINSLGRTYRVLVMVQFGDFFSFLFTQTASSL